MDALVTKQEYLGLTPGGLRKSNPQPDLLEPAEGLGECIAFLSNLYVFF